MEIKITLVQPDIIWEETAANLSAYEERLLHLTDYTDVVLLPEMFATGFTMEAKKLAEPMEGPTMAWMARRADQLQSIIAGSIIIVEDGLYYNRFIWMQPDGHWQQYDKRHLFGLAGEDKVYTAGTERVIWQWKDWRIMPQICYDLRFPVWARNQDDYDIYLNVANWPQQRALAWQTLLRARAIENQVFVIGLNRVGDDGKGHHYQGDSAVISPLGDTYLTLPDEEKVTTVTLNKSELADTRDRFPFYRDRDNFVLSP